MGVVSCEKRIACQRGVVNERPRTESAVLDRQGNETVKRRLKDGEPKIRRTKMRKYNKKKADETFGQLYGHLRHVQRFLGISWQNQIKLWSYVYIVVKLFWSFFPKKNDCFNTFVFASFIGRFLHIFLILILSTICVR